MLKVKGTYLFLPVIFTIWDTCFKKTFVNVLMRLRSLNSEAILGGDSSKADLIMWNSNVAMCKTKIIYSRQYNIKTTNENIPTWDTHQKHDKCITFCTISLKLFNLEHMFFYKVCSTQRDLSNMPLINEIFQSWLFYMYRLATRYFRGPWGTVKFLQILKKWMSWLFVTSITPKWLGSLLLKKIPHFKQPYQEHLSYYNAVRSSCQKTSIY